MDEEKESEEDEQDDDEEEEEEEKKDGELPFSHDSESDPFNSSIKLSRGILRRGYLNRLN